MSIKQCPHCFGYHIGQQFDFCPFKSLTSSSTTNDDSDDDSLLSTVTTAEAIETLSDAFVSDSQPDNSTPDTGNDPFQGGDFGGGGSNDSF